MFKNILFFLVISCCSCLLWCSPTRDYHDHNKYDIVTDERQTGVQSPQANIHLKFDGLLVAVPAPTQLNGVSPEIYEGVLGAIFGNMFDLPFMSSEPPPAPAPQVDIDKITTIGLPTSTEADTTTNISSEDTGTVVSSSVNIEAVSNADRGDPPKLDGLLPAAGQSSKDADEASPSILTRMHRPDENVPPPIVNKEYLQSVSTATQEQTTDGEKKYETTTNTSDLGTSTNVAKADLVALLSTDIDTITT